jgi:CRISPR/Cas system-associated protein Cas10 (large subunit of type III CRISPR-Cas system)
MITRKNSSDLCKQKFLINGQHEEPNSISSSFQIWRECQFTLFPKMELSVVEREEYEGEEIEKLKG